uniref:Uncharacterized protein n=1 Tax=Ditylenchus dipsaci TaxID=166011 RepID=A0A915EIG2_9BILA
MNRTGRNGNPEVLPPVQPMEELEDDDYDVWLVRKPKEVSLEEIAHIKFRRKQGLVRRPNRLRFGPPCSQMFHVHTKIANNAKHLRNLKPCAKIKDAEQQPGQQNTEELGVRSSSSIPVSIDSIRRKPVWDFKGLKERLKVFGDNRPCVVRRKRRKTDK